MKVHAVSTYSSRGGRPAQEDHFLADQAKGIFAIADGFGGPVPGFAAAETACESVRQFLFKEAGDLDATLPFELRSYFSLAGNVLFNALIHANRKLIGLNKSKSVHERGGASLLAGFIDGDLLALANVGGCTAWLGREGRSKELVAPRTYGRLRDPFLADACDEDAVPLMALGMARDLEPEIVEYKLKAGDWLLMHTDGLLPSVRDRILDLRFRGMDAQTAPEEVRRILEESKFEDNTSILLVIL